MFQKHWISSQKVHRKFVAEDASSQVFSDLIFMMCIINQSHAQFSLIIVVVHLRVPSRWTDNPLTNSIIRRLRGNVCQKSLDLWKSTLVWEFLAKNLTNAIDPVLYSLGMACEIFSLSETRTKNLSKELWVIPSFAFENYFEGRVKYFIFYTKIPGTFL